MKNKIIFTKNAIMLVCGHETLVFVDLFGGMPFRGSAIVGYEFVTQKKPGVSYAYLEIFEGNEKGVLFNEEPTYNFKSGHYESNGKKITDLRIEFEEDIQFDIPKNRLLMLHAQEGNSWVWGVYQNKSWLLPDLFLFYTF